MSDVERLHAPSDPHEQGGGAETMAWDLPTRLFKWGLVALVVLAWVSSGFEDPAMKVHKAAGYGILVLLVFRSIWGFVGGSTARFASFVRGPWAALSHLRALRQGRARPYLGHNPVGSLMVLALLLACSVQVALGLAASDGVIAGGPFADTFREGLASAAGALHGLWFYVLLGLASVHILANLYYEFIKGESLIVAMVTGRKQRAAFVDAPAVILSAGGLGAPQPRHRRNGRLWDGRRVGKRLVRDPMRRPTSTTPARAHPQCGDRRFGTAFDALPLDA